MSKIHFAAAIVAAPFLSLASASAQAPRPNIILAMADDMGWGDPSCYSSGVTFANGSAHPDQGWISTPTIDAMASNGLRFDRFYAASAVCSPTRASCLTGRNPFRVGVPFANTGRMGFDETPLSEVLSDAGYLCGHFGKWHLGTMTTLRADSNRGPDAAVYSAPWHHGYDTCFATESKVPTYHPYRTAQNGLALPTSFTHPNFAGTYYWRMPATWNTTSGEGDPVPVGEVNNSTNGDDSKLLVDQAIPFIQDAVAQNKPFFLVVWFHTPHMELVDPDGVSGVNSSDACKDAIEDMDLALGRLRAELVTQGVQNDTMFWFTSDNGPEDTVDSPSESSTERSIRSGRFLQRKRSLHEGGLRVPAILEWPGMIPTARTTDFPSYTSDYYTTIIDYLELSVPGQKPLDGISLRPLIGNSVSARTSPMGFLIDSDRSWVNDTYKLIDDGSGWELYDLVNVPSGQEVEGTPLATASNVGTKSQAIQDTYNEMLDEYNNWVASVNADEPYVHTSRPTVILDTGGAATDDGVPFTLTATFSEPVSQLQVHEFIVTNGTASNLAGTSDVWTVDITPDSAVEVVVELPEGAAIDVDGNPNASASSAAAVEEPPPLAQTALVDTGRSENMTPGNWNNVHGPGASTTLSSASVNLIDENGDDTGITLSTSFANGGSFTSGPGADYGGPYPSPFDMAPVTAAQDSMWIKANNFVTFTFSGLEETSTYDLSLYGGRVGAAGTAKFTVTDADGATTKTGSNDGASAPVVTFDGLVPNASRQITMVFTSLNTSVNGVLNVMSFSSIIDNDMDGMSNSFELEFGLNPDDPSDAGTDLDGDGKNNLEEFNAGTDPSNGDTDNDGIKDLIELEAGSDPNDFDSTPTFPVISWNVEEFTSQSQLDTSGALLYAENFNGLEVDLNGIPFTAQSSTNPIKSTSNVQTHFNDEANIGGIYDDFAPSLSNPLESVWYRSNATLGDELAVNIGLTGLTPGMSYLIQFGRADDRSSASIIGRWLSVDSFGGGDNTAPIGPTNTIYGGPDNPALLFSGIFTATSTVQGFTTGHYGSDSLLKGSQLSFLQVRETDFSFPMIVRDLGFDEDEFAVTVSGLNLTRQYRMMRSVTLADDFPDLVDGPRLPESTTEVFTDSNPPTERGFYRIELVPE